MKIKQSIVPLVIAAVLIGAAVGILALLTGFGPLKLKILLTDAVIAVGSICFLICISTIHTNNRKPLIGVGVIGAATTVFCSVCFLKFIWFESTGELLMKMAVTNLIVSIGMVYITVLCWFNSINASALSILNLTCVAACSMVMALIVMFLMMIWIGIDIISWKLIGTLGILLAACTILMPILYKSFSIQREKIDL